MRTQITINTNEMDKAQLTWDGSFDEAYEAAMDDVNAYNFLSYITASISDETIYLTLDFDTEGYIDSVQEIARSYIKLFLDVEIADARRILESALACGAIDKMPDIIICQASEIDVHADGVMKILVVGSRKYYKNDTQFMLYEVTSSRFGRVDTVHTFSFNNLMALNMFAFKNYSVKLRTTIRKLTNMYLEVYIKGKQL